MANGQRGTAMCVIGTEPDSTLPAYWPFPAYSTNGDMTGLDCNLCISTIVSPLKYDVYVNWIQLICVVAVLVLECPNVFGWFTRVKTHKFIRIGTHCNLEHILTMHLQNFDCKPLRYAASIIGGCLRVQGGITDHALEKAPKKRCVCSRSLVAGLNAYKHAIRQPH